MDFGVDIAASGVGLLFCWGFFDGRGCESRRTEWVSA